MRLKTKGFTYKLVAVTIALLFVFLSLHKINAHTYTTGVDNFDYICGCMGCW